MTRKSPRLIAAVGLSLLTLLCGTASFAQDSKPAPVAQQPAAPAPVAAPAAPQETGTKIPVTSSLVVVPVTVKDGKGNLVPDLKKEDFRIFEDGVEQRLSFFTADAFPLSMVVLVDGDLKRKDAGAVESSLRAIVGGLGPNDEATLATFDQFFHEGKDFTHNQDDMLTELKRVKLTSSNTRSSAPPVGGPFEGPTINNAPAPGAPQNTPGLMQIKGQPNKALDDAVFAAAELLKNRPRDRRKIILLISDGLNGPKFNTHKYDDTLAELLRNNIAVYSVAVGSSYFERKFNRLVSYAKDTGGDVFYGMSGRAFEDFYSRIAEQARNQYTLAYAPKDNHKVDYHSIEVRVRREGLNILAREGYYGGTFATEAPK